MLPGGPIVLELLRSRCEASKGRSGRAGRLAPILPAPREAAWKADEAYRRFIDVVPADVLVSAVEAAEYWRLARERIYAEKGMP